MNLLRELRTGLGLSQNEVARALVVSAQTVWAWEHDRVVPSWDRLDDLLEVYRCDRKRLIDWLTQQAGRVALAKRAVAS